MEAKGRLIRRVEALEEAAGPTLAQAWRTICRDLGIPFSQSGAVRHEGRLAELYGEGLHPFDIARTIAAELGVSFDTYKRALTRAVKMYG